MPDAGQLSSVSVDEPQRCSWIHGNPGCGERQLCVDIFLAGVPNGRCYDLCDDRRCGPGYGCVEITMVDPETLGELELVSRMKAFDICAPGGISPTKNLETERGGPDGGGPK